MAQPQDRNNNAVNDARRTATVAGRNVENIPQLPMVKVDQERVDNGDQCTTCLETFTLNEKVVKLKCQHIFHRACIQPWLQRQNTCPVCRTKVEWRREGVVKMEQRDLRAVNMQRRDMGVVNMQRRDLEDVDIDAVSELLHHTVENVPIINAAARGIAGIVQAVDNGNEQIRQAVERVEEFNRRALENVEDMNRQAIANVEMAGRVIDNLASLFTGAWF